MRVERKPGRCETCGITTRRGRGPRPKRCWQHRITYEADLRRTRYLRPRKYTEPVRCADCPAVIEIPEHGKPPKRCPSCTEERRREQNAGRQRRFRERKS